MTLEEKNTKQKIIFSASELFAQNGYNGTSVRDIAKVAGVNLAAINYHFKNKQGLYSEVFQYYYNSLTKKIEEIGSDQELTTIQLAYKVYEFFLSHGQALLINFKIFVQNDVPIEEISFHEDDNNFGPPGAQVFMNRIEKDLKKEICEEDKNWAARVIFTYIVHTAIILNSSLMKKKCQTLSFLSPEKQNESLDQLVTAILNHINNK